MFLCWFRVFVNVSSFKWVFLYIGKSRLYLFFAFDDLSFSNRLSSRYLAGYTYMMGLIKNLMYRINCQCGSCEKEDRESIINSPFEYLYAQKTWALFKVSYIRYKVSYIGCWNESLVIYKIDMPFHLLTIDFKFEVHLA